MYLVIYPDRLTLDQNVNNLVHSPTLGKPRTVGNKSASATPAKPKGKAKSKAKAKAASKGAAKAPASKRQRKS